MLHLFKSAASRAVTLGLIGLLVIGLLIGATRLALPFADLFRSELEGMLSETLGLPVRVGHMGLRLAGLAPRLTLRNAQLLDPESGRPQLSLEQLRIDLDLAASLGSMAPKIDSVTLVGAQLVIKRLQDGRMVLSGLEGLEAGDPEALTFFFGNGRFLVADSDLYWIDEKAWAPALHFSDVRIDFENADVRHRIGVLAGLFGEPQTRLQLVGDLRGEPGKPADWSGEVYIHWQGGSLSPVLEGRLPEGLHLDSDSVDLQSWNHLEGSRLDRSLDRVAAEGLRVWSESGEGSMPPQRLDRLEGLLRWQRLAEGSGDGWRLEVKDPVLSHGGARTAISDLGIRFTTGDDGGWTAAGGAEILDLGEARDWLAQLTRLFPDALRSFAEIRPEGLLHDLRLRVLYDPRQPPRWAASGRIEDMGLAAQGNFPGIRGLSAEIAGNEREGKFVLSTDDLELDFPRLFPNPIGLDEAAGEVHWKRNAEGALLVGARDILAANNDVRTRSAFTISLPADGSRPILDLHTEFWEGQVSSIRRYIPSKRIKEKLATWLDRAFVDGRIRSGILLFRGAPPDFPFDEGQGRFQVLVDVEDGVLDVNPDWPRIEEITAKVRFENRSMEILASRGRFLDNALKNVSVRIPDLSEAVAVEVRGTAKGTFADGLRVLGETPLRKRLGVLPKTFEGKGIMHLDLDMAIPLRHNGHKGPLRLTGELSWPGPATLAIADLDLELTDLAGKLRFTEHILEAQSITAKLWDVPLSLSIDTREPQGDAEVSTHIRADGRFSIPVLAQQFPSRAWESVEGRARLGLDLDIPWASLGESVPPIQYELTSDLAGLAVELPAPLGKPAAGTRRFLLSGRMAPGKELPVQGDYGDLGINLGLVRDSDGRLRLARGAFSLGGAAPRLPEGEGLHLSGSIAALDVQPWLDWWADHQASTGGDPGGGIRLRSADVHIGRLLVSDTAFDEVRVNAIRGRDRWEAEIKARELEGQVTIPHRPRGEPVRIALQRLDLKSLLGEAGKKGEEGTENRYADPRRANTLNLSVDRLLWGENPLGHLIIRSQAASEGLDFTDLEIVGPFMTIKGSGNWIQEEKGPHSSLSLTAKGSDLGEFLRSLEFESLIRKAPANLELHLDWPGGPLQYSAADLSGKILLDVEEGSLLEVEPGVGRVLGILNLQPLQRRLSLDFSDLFGRGFAFDKISGKIKIGKGEAVIDELTIEGPSAEINIAGSANLVDKELDQIATVTPRIGTGVAIASAVAGGPLVGAAVFLADKVSGGAVDKLGRHQYVLTGPWTEPEIRRGKWGGKAKVEEPQADLLKDQGRAGASGLHETKPRGKGTLTRAETEGREQGGSPTSSQGDSDENLFLELY